MNLLIRYIAVILFVFLFNGLDNTKESRNELSKSVILCSVEECVLREAHSGQHSLIDGCTGQNPQAEYRGTSSLRGSQYFKQIHIFNTFSHTFSSGAKKSLYCVTKRCDNLSNSPVDYFVYGLHRIIV